jgi:CheY-like chemotaxis protein
MVAETALGPPQSETAEMSVLVVEDNPDAALSMAMLLRHLGYVAFVAPDGPTAIREAEEHYPDVVLLDIGLPGMDGYEVARRIRQLHSRSFTDRPLFIAITGYGRREDRQRSREAGIDLHLVKPANIEHLEDVLKRFKAVLDARMGEL